MSAHTPSPSAVEMSQDDPDPTTYEHDRVVAPCVAVIVIVSPAVPPVADTVGVVSDVRLSVEDVPRSDDASRSGVPGAEGAVVSMVIGRAVPATDWFPAGSVTLAVTDHAPDPSAVPMSHEVATPTT